jgi:hypothetical protein
VFKKHGVKNTTVVGETTAIGGSRADQWAKNQKGKADPAPKLDILDKALKDYPEVNIVHLSIGRERLPDRATEEDLVGKTPEQRKVIWERICKDIKTLIDHIKRRPDEVVLSGYITSIPT